MKLMGSISRIFTYRPSVVSTMPFWISLTGRKGWTNSSFSGFLLFTLAFRLFEFFRVIGVTDPPVM